MKSYKKLNSKLDDGSSTRHRSAETDSHPLVTFKVLPFIWIFFDENGANKDASPSLPENFVGTEKIRPCEDF